MNKKTLLAIIIGLATCVTSVYFLFQYAANYQQLMNIVVPKNDISAYAQLTEENLKIKQVPVGSVDNRVAIESSQVLGKVTTVPLFAGEQIRLERLMDKRTVDVNKQQVAVNVNLTRSVAGTLKPGDLVDVYWVTANSYTSKPIARNSIVMEIMDGQGLLTTNSEQKSVSMDMQQTTSLPAVALLAVNPAEVPQVVKGSADKSVEVVLVKKLKEGGQSVNVNPNQPVQTGTGEEDPNKNTTGTKN